MATQKKAKPDVGHRRPPVGTKFKPGRSGNPRGRPKGSRNHVSVLFELLNEELPAKHGSMTRLEMIIRDLVDEAVAGKPRAVLNVHRLMGEFDEEPESEVKAQARMRAAGIKELKRREEEYDAARRKLYAERKKAEQKAEDKRQSDTADAGKAAQANSDGKAAHVAGGMATDAKASDEKVADKPANADQKKEDDGEKTDNKETASATMVATPSTATSPDSRADCRSTNDDTAYYDEIYDENGRLRRCWYDDPPD